ncbi:MAG: hypothetical protein AMJ84_11165 [Acidithiobacillales bacterium SM23_46]|jgi:hypothetical protein|nr:MAG: hypothetical protein AMJ84_11165 [Acidithiobacillales bacterium SM23_46]KPL28122.1 MAG: hypothetical protein AMJ72_05030 [Acidithiobacillales bacterium SM1_46]
MTLTSEIASLLLLAGVAWFWQQALRGKEIARSAGKRACDQAGVQFLDDTVELTRLRWRRDAAGGLRIYRHYRFEFAADGSHRFRGELALLGTKVQFVELEPYRLH